MPTLPKSMKTRFKIVGKRPGNATRYQLTGTVTNYGPFIPQFAKWFIDYYASACRENWPKLPADQRPTAKTITVTFTLP